jgi:YidC/Oxa1 family membrane protein insertase
VVPPVDAQRATGAVAEVKTPLYEAGFGADGSVVRWILEYRGPKPILGGAALGPLAVAVHREGRPPEMVALRPEADRVEITPAQPTGTLTFSGATGDGLRVRRTLEFRADSFQIGSRVEVEGGPSGGKAVDVLMYWTTPVARPGAKPDAPWHTFGEGPSREHLLGRILVGRAGQSPEVHEHPAPALKDPKESPGGPELKDPHLVPDAVVAEAPWAALEDDYFVAAMIARPGTAVSRGRNREFAEVGLVFPGLKPGAKDSGAGAAELYIGPKEWRRLKAVGVGLEAVQDRNYGYFLWFSSWGAPPLPVPWVPMAWFCIPLLWVLNFFGSQLPGANYGVAIILLTVLVKALFYPLSLKSMRSMKQMQALQPQLNALRAKLKSDPQRFQREQMELFKKHKVNPVGGCLPMIVQIPIFYALYLTLQYSVELQGAPFLLWISDLSKKDPYYVLPILMGISMLVQQKMTPTTGDPRQAQIMLIMPVIFTFMFLEFPTGLVLYWLVNNVLSVAQQYWIDRTTVPVKATDREGRRA